ncbi:MAG: heat-shock protein Hsp20 [Euryarchaeota archaeon]|jgi:molecular chaperone IbpA|nr:heat-shock protein Hsp20 [Euryarchaeota archaeon]
MTRLTHLDLQPIYRNSIGVDRLFDTILGNIEHASSSNYPPYNILKKDDDNYIIEVAVAGFDEGEIDVTTHDGVLTIKGEKADVSERPTMDYLHQGIGTRKFERVFNLSDYVEVVSASVANGILSVELERNVPDSMKPKTIAIDYNS